MSLTGRFIHIFVIFGFVVNLGFFIFVYFLKQSARRHILILIEFYIILFAETSQALLEDFAKTIETSGAACAPANTVVALACGSKMCFVAEAKTVADG